MTQATCAECGQTTEVPFVPTPGRPVYCRSCFQKRSDASGPRGPRPGPGGGGGYAGNRGAPRRDGFPPPRGPPAANQRKRMLAQGRKGHFMYDAREAMRSKEGGMDDQHHRAFLEGLFARGARDSTAAAQDFLDEKVADNTITPDERRSLGQLLERYSFWR